MTDQIKAVENLITANAATKPRTPQLDAARGYLASAMTNMQDHVSELARQCEERKQAVAAQQAKLQELTAQAEPAAATE